MKAYKDLVEKVLTEGTLKKNRTGIDTLSISGHMFEHNLQDGFPLGTLRRIPMKTIAVELEFFIKGLTDKRWLQERGCNYWNSWANPKKVPYGHDEETKKKMYEESDLGKIYGYQWRSWKGYDNEPIDQLKSLVETLKKDPTSRRMLCSSWNVGDFEEMSLYPCAYNFQIISDGTNVDLIWNQRSVDIGRGIYANVTSMSLLLLLIAKEANLVPRKVIGFLGDVHIYQNQIEGLKELIKHPYHKLPTVEIPSENWKGIFEWTYKDFELKDYTYNKVYIDLGEIAV